MIFRDIKPDYSLHLFDREKLQYSEVKVSSVGAPRFENKVGAQPAMVVDITVDVDGKPVTYSFPDQTGKYYVGTMLVATDKADIIADLKALRTSSERAIREVEHHKETVSRCSDLLTELDTEEKAKQETEQRFSNIESNISKMMDLLTKLTK